MTDQAEVHRVLRGLFGRDSLYVVLWGVQLVAAALFTPVTTRLLGATRFGDVAAAIAVMQVLVAIGSFSLQTAIQRVYARHGDANARRVVALAIVIALVTFAAADATGWLWSPLIGLHSYSPTIRYAVIWATLTSITNASLGLLRSRDRLGLFATVSLMQSVLAEGLALALVVIVHRTAAEYIFGQMLAQAAAAAVALIAAPPALPRRADTGMLAASLRYSAALVPAALAGFVIEASDRLVVHGALGPVPTARYAVARNIGGLLTILLGVLNSVWMPRVFALEERRLRASVLSASRDALYALMIPALVALSAGAPIVLMIWVPPSYHPEGLLLVVAIVAVTAFPVAAGMSSTRVLLFAGGTGAIGIATVLAAALNLGLNLALVPALGIEGSALATLLSYGLLAAILWERSARVLRLSPPARSLQARGAVGIALAFAFAALPPGGIFIAVRLLATLLAAAGLILLLTTIVAPERVAWASRLRAWIALPNLTRDALGT